MKTTICSKFVIRKGIIILSFILLTGFFSSYTIPDSNSQKSGTIKYKMEYRDLSLKFKLFKMFLPDECVLLFNPRFQRIQTSVSFVHFDLILDKELRVMYSIEYYEDKPLVLKEPLTIKEKERKVEILDDFKEINGIMCRRKQEFLPLLKIWEEQKNRRTFATEKISPDNHHVKNKNYGTSDSTYF